MMVLTIERLCSRWGFDEKFRYWSVRDCGYSNDILLSLLCYWLFMCIWTSKKAVHCTYTSILQFDVAVEAAQMISETVNVILVHHCKGVINASVP